MPDAQSDKQSFAARFANTRKSFSGESMIKKSASDIAAKPPVTQAAQQAPHAQKQIDPMKKMQADLIYLVKGIDAGRNAWYYVLVDRLKLQLFLKALNDDIIHLENYGKILYSAYGDEPPADITNKLKDEYGIK